MPRELTRGQTQILFRYTPESIFDHDDFGLCRVTSITLTPLDPGSLNDSALFEAIADTISQWPEEFRRRFPDMRDPAKRAGRFRYGQPEAVNFKPFPENVQCRKCGYVAEYTDVVRSGSRHAQCPRPGCGGTMRQLRYVEAHNCGRMKQLFVPKGKACRCGETKVKLYDPGRTALARWVCVKCNAERQRLLMTPCECEYSKSLSPGDKYGRKMRVYPAGEPGLYNPLVVTFINFQQRDEQRLEKTPDAEALLLARAWGILNTKVLEVAQERSQWLKGAAEKGSDLSKVVEQLRKFDPHNPLVKEHDAKLSSPPGQAEIDRVNQEVGTLSGGHPSRRLIEHVALRDNMRITSAQLVAEHLSNRGQAKQGEAFLKESGIAMQRLGLMCAEAVENFPIAQAAFGFTRVTKDPQRSSINPFSPGDQDSRLPIYTLPTETEALWFQLDPMKVAGWLVDNNIVQGSVPKTQVAAWAWLWKNALQHPKDDEGNLRAPAEAVQTLMHTISHVMLQRMEWSGYASSSIGEYLLPETLSFALYANRFTESKIGGLLTLFEQRLPIWLHEAGQQGRDCIYDPICTHDGGSCAGCMHREYNCVHFNRLLSRAVLYGGPLPQQTRLGQNRIKKGYWSDWIEPDEQ